MTKAQTATEYTDIKPQITIITINHNEIQNECLQNSLCTTINQNKSIKLNITELLIKIQMKDSTIFHFSKRVTIR